MLSWEEMKEECGKCLRRINWGSTVITPNSGAILTEVWDIAIKATYSFSTVFRYLS